MKKVLAIAVLAALVGFGSGCKSEPKKDMATNPPPLEPTPSATAYNPPAAVTQVPTAGPNVPSAPMGGGMAADPAPVKSPTVKHSQSSKATKSGASKISGNTYTIKAGDTLQKISLSKYGTTKRWKAILKANPQIKNPDKLIVGQKIKLP